MDAPPQLPAKELDDHGAPPHTFLRLLGEFFLRIIRLETHFRLFPGADTASLGG